MPQLKNSEIIKHVLLTLINKIGRRTSESFAVIIIDTVMRELESKYDFLKYAKIENTLYSEGIEAIHVMPEINSVESDVFFKAVKELISTIVRDLDRTADFFFIREFRGALDNVIHLDLEKKGINLSRMQFRYIDNRKEELKIKNLDVVEHVIGALAIIVNQIIPEEETIKTMITTIKKLEMKYGFFKYIEITDKPDNEGFYYITVLPEMNNIRLAVVGEAIQRLIGDVGKLVVWKDKKSFIEAFENELGEKHLLNIKKMGVQLSRIETASPQLEHDELARKSIQTLIDIMSDKTSKSFALATMDSIIKKLEEKHDVLKYISIEKLMQMQGADIINIMPEINLVKSDILGKAIQDIVKIIYTNLEGKNEEFLEKFKTKLGDEYLTEIENIGVNLHLLQLNFNLKNI
jgi:hypothetical protein